MGLVPKEFKEMLDPANLARMKDALKEFATEVDKIYYNTNEILKRLDALEDNLGIKKEVKDDMQDKV